MESIYIVLTQTYSVIARTIKLFTHDKYSHVSISFDKECKHMYSFGRKYKYFPFYGVFNHEELDKGLFTNKGSLIAIYEVKISRKKYNRIKKKVKNIKENNRGYNILGLNPKENSPIYLAPSSVLNISFSLSLSSLAVALIILPSLNFL